MKFSGKFGKIPDYVCEREPAGVLGEVGRWVHAVLVLEINNERRVALDNLRPHLAVLLDVVEKEIVKAFVDADVVKHERLSPHIPHDGRVSQPPDVGDAASLGVWVAELQHLVALHVADVELVVRNVAMPLLHHLDGLVDVVLAQDVV